MADFPRHRLPSNVALCWIMSASIVVGIVWAVVRPTQQLDQQSLESDIMPGDIDMIRQFGGSPSPKPIPVIE